MTPDIDRGNSLECPSGLLRGMFGVLGKLGLCMGILWPGFVELGVLLAGLWRYPQACSSYRAGDIENSSFLRVGSGINVAHCVNKVRSSNYPGHGGRRTRHVLKSQCFGGHNSDWYIKSSVYIIICS